MYTHTLTGQEFTEAQYEELISDAIEGFKSQFTKKTQSSFNHHPRPHL